MGGLSTWFTFNKPVATDEIPDIFPLDFERVDFIKADVVGIYSKILTDVIERTHGLDDDQKLILWDNCVKSDSTDGLITQLAKAMYEKKDLFLVYENDVNVLRAATTEEQRMIKEDYEKEASSDVGVYISFKNYYRTDMVRLYSALEYCAVAGLNKTLNLSKSIQLKLDSLRGSVSMIDAASVRSAAIIIARSLGEGRDIMLDGKDTIETATPDLTPTKESINFLNQKRAYYLGLPASYLTGEQTGGLGSTGENDTKAVERGLKSYYESIIRPVLLALFGDGSIEGIEGVELKYKSQDFRQIDQGLAALKTFELTGDEFISGENKKKIIEALFDLDEEPWVEPAAPDMTLIDPNVQPASVVPGKTPPVKPNGDQVRA